MRARAADVSRFVIDWQIDAVTESDYLNASLTSLNRDGSFDIRSTVVLKPHVCWNGHAGLFTLRMVGCESLRQQKGLAT
jgi:hypothetical protein